MVLSRKTLIAAFKIGYCAGIALMTVGFSMRDSRSNLIREATIEAGSPIRIEDFFRKAPEEAEFITSVSSIDTNVPAVYKLKLHYDVVFNETVTLKIEDTVSPTGEGLTRNVLSYDDIPDASEMVTNVNDLSGISSIEYVSEPDLSASGNVDAPVRITDSYGNSSIVNARFIVTKDTSAPVIHGITDIKIKKGEKPDLSKGIYATDDLSKNVPVRIDASKLNIEVPGKYKITYTAEDDAGNVTTAISTVTVKKKEEKKNGKDQKKSTPKPKKKTTDYGEADKLAEKLVKKLKKGSKVETARAIFKWVHKNIHYVQDGSKATGKKAAYKGLTKHSGNCRVYAYTCQLLLKKAGIKNMIVKRYPVTTRHYWNLVYLNGGWYHCDATPFRNHPKIYFMLTDSQLDKHHQFKKDKYPARATK